MSEDKKARTRDEMIDAVKNRIKQLDEGMKILEGVNQLNSSYWRMDAVKEELETFLKWSEGT